MEKKFKIDIYELCYILLSASSLPNDDKAKITFIANIINKHYHNMTLEERAWMFNWLQKNIHCDCDIMNMLFNRLDPSSQYVLVFGDSSLVPVFLHEGVYLLNTYIPVVGYIDVVKLF